MMKTIRERWNEQADGYNQWSDLGLDEKEEFADRCLSEREGKLRDVCKGLRMATTKEEYSCAEICWLIGVQEKAAELLEELEGE
jgi:hypothetical protein